MQSNHRFAKATAALALIGSVFAAHPAQAQINLTAGDVAIIGWVDNGTPDDVFTIVALADLPAGASVYFTDNGWDGVAGAFRNTIGPNDGDGNEQMMKLDVIAPIAAGTILSTTDTGASFAWTASGAIPGATTGSFDALVLAQTGDQICAFQHDSGTNPLNTPVQQALYVLDDTGTFENATTTATGNVPPGLSVASNTATTFAQSASAQNFMGFNTLALASGSKAQWLAAIHDPANWTFGTAGTLPSGTINVGSAAIFGYCFGDGSLATACPCANAGQSGKGCDNSAATGGGQLLASGTTMPDTLLLSASGVLNTVNVFLQGDANTAAGVIFGDGVRCVSGTLIKLAIRSASGGTVAYPGAGDPSVTATAAGFGDTIAPGAVRYYQVYYRDPVLTFCDVPQGNSWNATNGLQVTW